MLDDLGLVVFDEATIRLRLDEIAERAPAVYQGRERAVSWAVTPSTESRSAVGLPGSSALI